MAYKVQKPCRVCGKMYTPCSDCERDKTAFHWRTVACSIGCGMEYFKMVEEARKPKVETKEVVVEKTTMSEKIVEEVEDLEVIEKRYPRKKTAKSENKEESEQIG